MSHADITAAARRYDALAARLASDASLTSASRAEQLAEAQATLLAELRGPCNEAERIAEATARDAHALRAAADHALTERGIPS